MKYLFIILTITLIITSCAPKEDSKVACKDISPLFSEGETIWNEDHYNIYNCGLSTITQSEMVKPALRDDKWKNARCNDGTPFGFSVQLSGSDEWVIMLQGGGVCNDINLPCKTRGKITTPNNPDRVLVQPKVTGVFNPDSRANPDFYEANKVFGFYCSSDVWSGTSTSTVTTTGGEFYFSGQYNFKAMIEILKERYGLEDNNPNTKVLLAGTSAGGQGVMANAHIIKELMPTSSSERRIKLVNDAGNTWNFDDPEYRPIGIDITFAEAQEQSYDFWHSSLNPYCEEAMNNQGNHPGQCFMTHIMYPYVYKNLDLPFLIQSSSIDSFFINMHGIDPERDPEALERFRTNSLKQMEGIDWLFSGGDKPYHTLIMNNFGLKAGHQGQTFGGILGHFWQDKSPLRIVYKN
ncbi:hypothetical protein ISS09_04325 [Candidatus Woesearchaeota archaeon]|nr:hypothetical protein [Candidatus Woesearchaeota archaeon]